MVLFCVFLIVRFVVCCVSVSVLWIVFLVDLLNDTSWGYWVWTLGGAWEGILVLSCLLIMLGITSLFNYHIRFLNNGKYKDLSIVNNMLFFKDNTPYVSFPSKLISESRSPPQPLPNMVVTQKKQKRRERSSKIWMETVVLSGMNESFY